MVYLYGENLSDFLRNGKRICNKEKKTILVDAGLAGTYNKILAGLRKNDIRFENISLIVLHMHTLIMLES